MQTPQRATAANRQFLDCDGCPSRDFLCRVTRFGATSVSSLFICQTDHQQIKNGDHDACDHDRVKMTALLYGFDQGRRIFRLDHFTRQHFLAKPRQDRTPQRRPSQGHYAECGEIHPNDSSRNRNDMADHWQKARKENAPCFVTTNPVFGPL